LLFTLFNFGRLRRWKSQTNLGISLELVQAL